MRGLAPTCLEFPHFLTAGGWIPEALNRIGVRCYSHKSKCAKLWSAAACCRFCPSQLAGWDSYVCGRKQIQIGVEVEIPAGELAGEESGSKLPHSKASHRRPRGEPFFPACTDKLRRSFGPKEPGLRMTAHYMGYLIFPNSKRDPTRRHEILRRFHFVLDKEFGVCFTHRRWRNRFRQTFSMAAGHNCSPFSMCHHCFLLGCVGYQRVSSERCEGPDN